MSQIFFITGTDTGAGKTVLTALLARHGQENQVRVAALKPLCSGGRADAAALYHALRGTLPLDQINPWHFHRPLAPLLAARLEGKSVRLAEVRTFIRAVRKKFNLVLVEGAGGLLSPLGRDFDSRDLIVALRATPIVVAQNKLGVINHLLLTLEALPPGVRSKARVVLMSPRVPDAASASNLKLLAPFFPAARTFTLPWFDKFPATALVKRASVKRILSKIIA
jgi:dethiobiotin synthetase